MLHCKQSITVAVYDWRYCRSTSLASDRYSCDGETMMCDIRPLDWDFEGTYQQQ